MKTIFALFFSMFFIFPAVSRAAEQPKETTQVNVGLVTIQDTSSDSRVFGELRMTETPEGLRVAGQVRGVSPGRHGIHIHEVGSCGEGGKAAGGHYNPEGAPHGDAAKGGPAHPGDLGNLEIDAEGHGTIDALLPGVTLAGGKYNVAGLAVILHEKEDDFGQPTGNAGGRIGCGPILLTKEQEIS